MADMSFVDEVVLKIKAIEKESRNLRDFNLLSLLSLYIRHKGYNIDLEKIFMHDDEMIISFARHCLQRLEDFKCLRSLLNYLFSIDKKVYNESYPDIVFCIIDNMRFAKYQGDFTTPDAINRLIAYFVNKEECQNVYDPYCGSASILSHLNCKSFTGADLYEGATIVAKLVADIFANKNVVINRSDAVSKWNNNHYDAVISCPPFEVRLRDQNIELIPGVDKTLCHTTEELLFNRAFKINIANVVISLEPHGFCFTMRHMKARRYLIDNNLLDTIVYLPSGVLRNTVIPSVLVICKSGRQENEPIKLIDATSFVTGDTYRNRDFNFSQFKSVMNTNPNVYVTEVSIDKIKTYDYNLNLTLYHIQNLSLTDGQQLVRLRDLFSWIQSRRIELDTPTDVCSSECFGTDVIETILNKTKVQNFSNTVESERLRCVSNTGFRTIVMYADYSALIKPKFALYDGKKNVACGMNVRFMQVNENLVNPEYLVYLLTTNEAILNSMVPLSTLENLRLVIDSKPVQKMIIERLKSQYHEKLRKETEADAERLGVKRNISDLEHMLGTPEERIRDIITSLSKMDVENVKYSKTLIKLKDNFEYMCRLIRYNNEDFSSYTAYFETQNVNSFFNEYVNEWNNYGSNCFHTRIDSSLEVDETLDIDVSLFRVMLDSVFGNATRHGFKKRFSENNLVSIELSKVIYLGKPYVLISIRNNGVPMTEGFTLEDYITRGRYSSNSGRSGLGGNHVYQVVKKHNGYLCLSSTKEWSVIVDMLIPVKNNENNKNLPDYGNNCV